jgi:hypothetical protein
MPSGAERSEPVTATIMLILIFSAFGILAWAVRHETELRQHKQSISKPVNK